MLDASGEVKMPIDQMLEHVRGMTAIRAVMPV